MSAISSKELIREFYNNLNQDKFDEAAELFHKNSNLNEPPEVTMARYKQKLRMRYKIQNILSEENKVIVHIERTLEVLKPYRSDIYPDLTYDRGTHLVHQNCTYFEFVSGKISKVEVLVTNIVKSLLEHKEMAKTVPNDQEAMKHYLEELRKSGLIP